LWQEDFDILVEYGLEFRVFFPVWHVDLQVLVECGLELRVFSPVLQHVDLQVLVECGLELGVSFQVLWHVDLQFLVECGSELECFSSVVACTFAGFVAPFSSTMPIQYWLLLQNIVLKHNRWKVCLSDDW
jgi:hypothetical protein